LPQNPQAKYSRRNQQSAWVNIRDAQFRGFPASYTMLKTNGLIRSTDELALI
jgi:hypothetical protein